MPDIEILPGEPGGADVDEVLDAGPRPVPRWWLAVGVAAGCVAALVLTLNRPDHPARPPASSPTAAPSAAVDPAAAGDFGETVPAGAGRPVLDVAVSHSRVWLLQSRSLHAIDSSGATLNGVVPGSALADETPGLTAHFVLDDPAAVMWVVVTGARPGRVLEYDAETLRVIRQVASTPALNGAAALDGTLYLTSNGRLFVLAPGRALRAVASVPGVLGQLVADPARNRVLMVQSVPGHAFELRTITPHGSRPQLSSPRSIRLSTPTVAATSDAIWLGGSELGHGALIQLDVSTLRPTGERTSAALGCATVIVVGGDRTVWVRCDRELRCVDATTGQQLQRWLVHAPVASIQDTAVVATPAGAIPLLLASCPG